MEVGCYSVEAVLVAFGRFEVLVSMSSGGGRGGGSGDGSGDGGGHSSLSSLWFTQPNCR